jgi:hypothetical protein
MGAPMLIPAIGAAAGALMKPNNPLQGALLGGITGYTGGQLYNAFQGVTPALASAAPVTAQQNALLGINPVVTPAAQQQTVGSLLGTVPPINASSAIPTQLGAPVTAAQRAALGTQQMVSAVSPSGVNVGAGGIEGIKNYAYANPGTSMVGFSSAKELLQPEPMPQAAPINVQAGRGVKPFNPIESMDPYRQSVISNQPISLLG